MSKAASKGIVRQSDNFYRRNLEELAAVEHRIDAYCHWFSCKSPELAYGDEGELLLDEGIVDWCTDQGASIDWIICGDPFGMAAEFRKSQKDEHQFSENLKLLDDQEIRAIEIGMNAYIEGLAPMEQTIKAAKQALKEVKEDAA